MLVVMQDGNGNDISVCMPGQETVADHSGTIAAAGTAQPAFPANATRSGWLFANQDAAPVHLNVTGDATTGAGSIPVAPGAVVGTGTGLPNVTGAISVIGATTGSAYTAWDW